MRFPKRVFACVLALFFAPSFLVHSAEVGSQNTIKWNQETKTTKPSGNGQSRTRNALVEIVLSRSDVAVEVEYRLPPSSRQQSGPSGWMFPVKIRKAVNGEIEVLNPEELIQRRDEWLDKHPQFQAVCGQFVFTWAAIPIFCEVDDVLGVISNFDLWFWDLSPGRLWHEVGTVSPRPLELVESNADGPRYEVSLQLDPKKLRQADAEAKLAVALMLGKEPPTMEDALSDLAGLTYQGSLVLGFQLDAFGNVIERTWARETITTDASGQVTTTVKTAKSTRLSDH